MTNDPGPTNSVNVSGDARVGIMGDHGRIDSFTVDNFNAVTPRRQVVWPVQVGSPPPLASAYQPRTAIRDALPQAGGSSSRLVLSGDGGTGKTQIAAARYLDSAAELRVWVQGGSRTSVVTGYADAALSLDLADPDSGSDNLANRFLGFLATTSRTWLVVIDDLTDPADLQGLWPNGAGQVIVTTRRRDAALTGGGRTIVDVDVYSPDEADSYLTHRLAPFADELPDDALAEAREMASELGHLPLALSHAAAVIIDQDASCRQYRAWFADCSRSLDELFPAEADADGYAKTVATTWVLAVDVADGLDPVGLARPMAHLIAVFDSAGAPEALCTGPAACEYLSAAANGNISDVVARKALRALDRVSLIVHDRKREPRAVRMHNLTGRAILQTIDDDEFAALALIACESLIATWPEIENDPALSEALRANTDVLRRRNPDTLWDSDSGRSLLLRSGESLRNAGLVAAAVAYHDDVANEATTRLDPEHPDTLIFRNNRASVYQDAGDLDTAIPLFQENLVDSERILGHDHPDTLTARNNLAAACGDAGDLDTAIPLHQRNLADSERILGHDHPDTLTARNNLAYGYQDAGDLGTAIPLFEENLVDSERILGHDHPDTLTAQNNLASAYQAAGLDSALPLYQRVLTDRERILGPDHPDTLAARNNLAYGYRSAGDLDRAVDLYQQNLADWERILGPDHPHILIARNNLAYTYQDAGDLDAAIPLFQQNLAKAERILGHDHPDTLLARNNLARSYQDAGDNGTALPLFKENLAEAERILGPDHPEAK